MADKMEFTDVTHDVSDKIHVSHCRDCIKLRKEIEARGAHFSDEQLKSVVAAWAGNAEPVKHAKEGLYFKLSNGSTFKITHHVIEPPEKLNLEWFRGAIENVKQNWGGVFSIGGVDSALVAPQTPPNSDYRLTTLAYARVFGVKCIDKNEKFFPLTKEEKDKLELFVKDIATHYGLPVPPAPPPAAPGDQLAQPQQPPPPPAPPRPATTMPPFNRVTPAAPASAPGPAKGPTS